MKAKYRYPVRINKLAWLYENPRSITVVGEVRREDGSWVATAQVHIPKRILEKLDLKK